jgi:hypothetical protein
MAESAEHGWNRCECGEEREEDKVDLDSLFGEDAFSLLPLRLLCWIGLGFLSCCCLAVRRALLNSRSSSASFCSLPRRRNGSAPFHDDNASWAFLSSLVMIILIRASSYSCFPPFKPGSAVGNLPFPPSTCIDPLCSRLTRPFYSFERLSPRL